MMSKYRIVKTYTTARSFYYRVDKRFLLFFWDSDSHFDSIEEARYRITQLIKDENVPRDVVIQED